MQAKSYTILSRAVEQGIKLGLFRAHKYTDKPSQETLEDNLYREVMNAISEVFNFPKETE